jgi:hypothetical protein
MYAIIIFLSAFLLFLVQPLAGRVILPWFGGTPAVWSTCMLFFQVLLLGGYASAYFLHRCLRPKMQLFVYTSLVLLSAGILDILPSAARAAQWSTTSPVLAVLLVLLGSVGLPYFALSILSPSLQAWFSMAEKDKVPYRLYAVSNLGSLLALFAYPALLEPLFTVQDQAKIWASLYYLFALLLLLFVFVLGARISAGHSCSIHESADASPPSWRFTSMWFLLAATSSTLLLAVTNHITYNIAVIPLFWLVPLGIYLLTFILAFESDRYYSRKLLLPITMLLILNLGDQNYTGSGASLAFALSYALLALFCCCLVCHGELARLKPQPSQLTRFYLVVALGGAAGGIFVVLVAPALFSDFYELPSALIVLVAAVDFLLLTDKQLRLAFGRKYVYASLIVCTIVVLSIMLSNKGTYADSVAQHRNFYGVLRVVRTNSGDPKEAQHVLMHGRVIHGSQYLSPDKKRLGTTYFGPASAIGRVLLNYKSSEPRRVAVIGLGAGTVATYGKQGDSFRFYEINPDSVFFAQKYFSFISDTSAQVDIVDGDARISLAREPEQLFDILFIDAFSGDAIPVHLLTKEAFELYFRRLTIDGVIVVHISNRYLDLAPVLSGIAAYFGVSLAVTPILGPDGSSLPRYAVLTRNNTVSDLFKEDQPPQSDTHLLWTDDYSNVVTLLPLFSRIRSAGKE